MQLLGPQLSQVDTIETCLHSLISLVSLEAVRGLCMEDFIDFILMDIEYVSTYSKKDAPSMQI